MEESSDARGGGISCFRCGVCCRKYTPRVTVTEAEQIAASLGMSLEVFRERYVDDSWFEPGYFLLDNQDEACIFLSVTGDSRIMSCQIYQLRPRSCREWQAGLDREECLEGLGEYWGLMVDSSGRLHGPVEKLREFEAFGDCWGC